MLPEGYFAWTMSTGSFCLTILAMGNAALVGMVVSRAEGKLINSLGHAAGLLGWLLSLYRQCL